MKHADNPIVRSKLKEELPHYDLSMSERLVNKLDEEELERLNGQATDIGATYYEEQGGIVAVYPVKVEDNPEGPEEGEGSKRLRYKYEILATDKS